MKSLSIILAVTEEADYLRETAEAARSACVDCGAEAELLVVTPTPYLQRVEEALRHIDDIQICPVETNSLALLNNYGRAFASGSCLLFVREGVLLDAAGLRALLDALAQNAEIGAVGPFSDRTVYEWQYLNAAQIEAEGGLPSTELQHSSPEAQDSLFLENFALLMRRDTFDQVGGFCADFPACGGEDMDLSFRLKRMGYRLLRVPVYLPHMGTGVYPIRDMTRSRARLVLLQRWGLDIGLPESLWQKALMAIDWQQNPEMIHATCRSVLLRAPLVSIFIMTYNRPEYFREALESALAQTYPNIEIIVGDFGTDDRTEQLVQDYLADPRIRYVRGPVSPKEEHHEIFHPLAQGEYIQWLMDDDMLLPDKLTLMMDAFLRNPNVTLVTSQRGVIDAEGEFTGLWPVLVPVHGAYGTVSGRETGRLLLTECTNFIGEPSIVLYRHESDAAPLVEQVVARGYQVITDVAMWLHFLAQGDCVVFTPALGLYRQHGGQEGQQTSTGIRSLVEWRQVLDEYRSEFLTDADYREGLDVVRKACVRFEPLSHQVAPELRRAYEEVCQSLMK